MFERNNTSLFQCNLSPSGTLTARVIRPRVPGILWKIRNAPNLWRGWWKAAVALGLKIPTMIGTLDVQVTRADGNLVALRAFLHAIDSIVTMAGYRAHRAATQAMGTSATGGTSLHASAHRAAGNTDITGAINQASVRLVSGDTAVSGSIAVIRVVLCAINETLAPAGTLARSGVRILAGAGNNAGVVIQDIARRNIGALVSIGRVIRTTAHVGTGAITSDGALLSTRGVTHAFSGALAAMGAVLRHTTTLHDGVIIPVRGIVRGIARALMGTLPSVGSTIGHVIHGGLVDIQRRFAPLLVRVATLFSAVRIYQPDPIRTATVDIQERRNTPIGTRTMQAREDSVSITYSPKDPDDIDDFTIGWNTQLAATETISTVSAVAIAGNIAIDDSRISGTDTIIRISGGDEGSEGRARVRITTSSGRQLDQTIVFTIRTA